LLKYILRKSPELIKEFYKNEKKIVGECIFVNGEINVALVDYLLNDKKYINELFEYNYYHNYYKNRYINHKKYKDLVIYILDKYPDIINYINPYHKDYLEIIINNINVINCDQVYISNMYKDHSKYKDHKNYKKLVMCILSKWPEFIKNIDINHTDYSEIVINSIDNTLFLNYLTNYQNKEIIIKILDKINNEQSNHEKYKVLVIRILENHPDLIYKIDINHKDFSEIVINSIFNINIKYIINHPNKEDILKKITKKYSTHKNYMLFKKKFDLNIK
jgi:hypothetical protein